MAACIPPFFTTLLSIFLLIFFHLGCFIFPTCKTPSNKKLKPISSSKPYKKSSSSSSFPSSSWSFIKHLFCRTPNKNKTPNNPTPSSTKSSIVSIITPSATIVSSPSRKRRTNSSLSELDISSWDHQSFPLRNDIYPCPTCGEIFHKINLLEQHQVIKHAVSELFDGDSGNNIVRILFKTGWNELENKNPKVHRILKIHNSPKIISKFEEYRESVKAKASKIGSRTRDERCVADGNELLRFTCATFVCNLGQNGNSSLCSQNYCSVCGIIRSGFSAKMDGISTLSNSWKAHAAVPEDLEEDFAFINVKRAMLVCRVVAGRIGSDQEEEKDEGGGVDSVVGRGGSGGSHGRLDEDELLVFNPRAVLPCFAIVYSV